MKIPNAARYNAMIWLGTLFYTGINMLPGLRITSVHFPRQGWIVDHSFYWIWGWGLWLMAILGWMWLLVALVWRYLPTQRMEFILQVGLIVIATGLAISGGIVWLAMLPAAMMQPTATTLAPLVDALALGLIGGGALIGGAVTTWIGWDLYVRKVLSRSWVWLCIGAGLCVDDAICATISLFIIAGGACLVGLVNLFGAKRTRGLGNSSMPTSSRKRSALLA